MTRFGYRAYDLGGKTVEGEIVSDSRTSALNAIRRRGEIPIEIVEGRTTSEKSLWQREIVLTQQLSVPKLAVYIRELATLVNAGLPLDDVLRIVAVQPQLSNRVRSATQEILDRVLEGRSLSQGLAAQGKTFPAYVGQLIAAGEESGKLGEVLDDLALFLERTAQVRAKVISALIYPAVLLFATALAIGVIIAVLLPVVVPLLKDAGASLPLIVVVLDSIRQLFADHWLTLVIAAVAVCAVSVMVTKSSQLRQYLSQLALRLPLIGGHIKARETARFTRILSTLLKSGVPLVDAILASGRVSRNTAYANAIRGVVENVKEGASLTRSLAISGYFPDVCLRLTEVGEQTGQLEEMLIRVADIFDASVQRRLERMASLLTPALTLFVGLIVGWLAISIMGALLSINSLATA